MSAGKWIYIYQKLDENEEIWLKCQAWGLILPFQFFIWPNNVILIILVS